MSTRLTDESTAKLLNLNEKFIHYVAKNKGVAYHIESGDEMNKEGFITYCASHYGDLEGFETTVNGDGQRTEVPARWPSGKVWWDWRDQRKRVVRRIVLEPGVETSVDVYNRWDVLKGTMAAPDMDATWDDIAPLVDLLMFISDGDKIGVAWTLNWLASLYRFPDIKHPHCLLLYSRYGRVGKSSLYELLSRVFGPPMVGCCAGHELHKNFMDFMEGRRLIVLNELAKSDKMDGYERFKNTVSERTLQFEGKGRASREMRNIAHFIVTTNNSDCLPLMEDDGRVLVLRCESKRRHDDYYRELHRWMSEEGPSKVAGMFSKWDFPDDWNPYAPVPQTAACQLTQEESKSPLVQFLGDLIDGCSMPFEKDFGTCQDAIEQIGTAYPSNSRTLRMTTRSVPQALMALGATQVRLSYTSKDGKRRTVRLWVWRNHNDWVQENGLPTQALFEQLEGK